jgi:hypothetical protein
VAALCTQAITRGKLLARTSGIATLVCALALAGCSSPAERTEPRALPAPRSSPAPRPAPATPAPPAPGPNDSPPGAAAPLPPPADPGAADLDPDNDLTVAPPEAIDDCEPRLAKAGVLHKRAELKLRQKVRGFYTCGAPQVVSYERGPGEISYNAPPLLTCGMALALARFELLLQEDAVRALGSRIARIQHGGTYSCRKMARFSNMVSEHSYANAIDIHAFVTEKGRRLSVKTHFGRLDGEPSEVEGQFLRSVSRQAFDRGLFSVVLTPFWDKLHADHLHLDLARYRVDGTRPQ